MLTYALLDRKLGPLVRALYRLEVRGAGHVPDGPLVVAANHESVLDPFVLGAAVPRPLRFLAKEELWRYRPVARCLDALGGIPVARGRGDAAAVAAARRALDGGEAVALFPEGAVRHQGPWLRGAARLALATGAPILPVRLLGTAQAMSPGTLSFPRTAALIGEPISVRAGRATIAASRELTAELQAAVHALGR